MPPILPALAQRSYDANNGALQASATSFRAKAGVGSSRQFTPPSSVANRREAIWPPPFRQPNPSVHKLVRLTYLRICRRKSS